MILCFLLSLALAAVSFAQEPADSLQRVSREAPAEAQAPGEQTAEQLWNKANTAYINGDFHAAADTYEELLSRGVSSMKLYYNLGNAYFKDDRIGKAILYYNRALRLAPGNDDIRYNLSVAEARTKDNIEDIPEFFFVTWMRDIRHMMGCTAWSLLSLALLACMLGLFLVYLLAQRISLRKAGFYGTVVAALLFMLTTWFAVGERREMLDDTSAVVMTASTAVKSSPDKSSTDLFVLHEGTVVTITDRLDGWCEVVIADGKKGWVEGRKIEIIRMSRLLQDVVGELSKLPGIGRRTALRLAIHILRMERESVAEMTESIDRFRNEVKYCTQCNNLSDEDVCPICADDERDHTTICVVEQVADVLSVENTRQYKGLYHVLGGVISPMQGISPSDLKIDLLTERIARGGVKEVILAISTSVEGETTLFYLMNRLRQFPELKVTSIARGIGFGDELEYVDELTITHALLNRREVE